MITKKDLKGQIAGFPIDVVEKMLERQKEQTGKEDVTIFQLEPTTAKALGGFDWDESIEGELFWKRILFHHNWSKFWEKYPSEKKPKEPKGTKKCPDCGEEKPVSEFYANPGKSDGLQSYCKECCKKRNAARRAKNKVEKAVKTLQDNPPVVVVEEYNPFEKFKDEQLIEELKRRGYKGDLSKEFEL